MRSRNVIAIACADIHLSHTPPACRAGEPDWYKAMARPLNELQNLALKYQVPILCAGDIFDRWDAPAVLVNWAIRSLPVMFAIPGQHDLPQHNYEEKHRSAYETLELASVVKELSQIHQSIRHGVIVWGFPWGHSPKHPCPNDDLLTDPYCPNVERIQIAVAHEYAWIPTHKYPTAPDNQRLTPKRKALQEFDVVIFGDNHDGFTHQLGKTTIFNCGTLMRRKVDEAHYKPQVGLIYTDGTVEPYYLDTSQDVIDLSVPESSDTKVVLEVQDFLTELEKLSTNPLDFREAVERYLNDNEIKPETKRVTLETMKL